MLTSHPATFRSRQEEENLDLSNLIRRARADDYQAITAIHNGQSEPDHRSTPERLLALDRASASRDPAFRRLVAEVDGEVVATGYFRATWAGSSYPGRYWVGLHVHENHRASDVDTRMLRHAIAGAPEPVREIWSCIREDFVPAASFLETEGFQELFRSWGAHLDLASFRPACFAPLTAKLRREGIELTPYEDLGGGSARDHRLLALQRQIEEDVLAFEPVIPSRHDDITGPDTIRDSAFVAVTVADGDYVGFASLVGERDAKHLACGLTGVARPYRNRGIATALKARVAQTAQAWGAVELNAGGGGADTPILRVNRKLGFDIEPAWITFACRP
jgi:GNAT superfamily N-acetyltransferase